MLKIEREYVGGHKGRVNVHGIRGWIAPEVALFMYDVAKRLGPGTYVELGCYLGASAICVAQGIKDNNIKDAHVITVDAFNGEQLNPMYKGAFSIESVTETFVNAELDHLITPVKGMTAEVAADYKDKEFNFLFIDADHTLEACSADFELWSPMVKSGGEVAFHDNNLKGVIHVLCSIPWPRRTIDKMTVFTKP